MNNLIVRMKFPKILILFLLALTSLAGEEKEYFPPNKDVTSRASKILELSNEPSLISLENTTDLECLRFTYIPSFGNPFYIRLTKRENIIHLKSITLNGLGGYEMGRASERREENKTGSWTATEILLRAKKCFSNEDQFEKGSGVDGSRWILEYLDENGYKVVDLWSPNYYKENEDFATTCRLLCEFAGLSLSHYENLGLLDPLVEDEFEKLKGSWLYQFANKKQYTDGPIDPFASPAPENSEVEPDASGQSHLRPQTSDNHLDL